MSEPAWEQFDPDEAWKQFERDLRTAIAVAFADEVILSDAILDRLTARGVTLAKERYAQALATHH